jgi:hypothetical protein
MSDRCWPWLVVASALVSSVGWADPAWLTTHGALAPRLEVDAFFGTRSVGMGLIRPDADAGTAGLTGELVYAVPDKLLEVRGARVWQLKTTGIAALSVSAGGTLYLVPDQLDLGLGPAGTLALALRKGPLTVDVALQSGVEFFTRLDAPRFPERVVLGATVALGDVRLSLQGRTGADLIPGHALVFRLEGLVSLGWLGLHRQP